MSTTPSTRDEKALLTASQHAEDWFPSVLKIWNSLPLGEEDWERAANLLAVLQNDFRDHAPVLLKHSDELLNAAAKANTGDHQFSILTKRWRCAHLALPDAIESFLRAVLHAFQPVAECESEVDLSRSVSAHEIQAREMRFSFTVKYWVSQYDPDESSGILKELIVGERANLQTNADFWSAFFPVVDWQPVWNPKREISYVKNEIKKLVGQNLAQRLNGKRNGDVSIRMQTLKEKRISPPRSTPVAAK